MTGFSLRPVGRLFDAPIARISRAAAPRASARYAAIALTALVLVACGPEIEPHRAGMIRVINPSSTSWIGAPVTVDLGEIGLRPEGPIRVYRETHRGWNEVPGQVDDLNGDGSADELFFLLDMAGEERTRVEIVEGGWPPGYRPRTDASLGVREPSDDESAGYRFVDSLRLTHAEEGTPEDPERTYRFGGPVWESAQIVYRAELGAGGRIGVLGKRLYRVRLRTVAPDPDTGQSWGSRLLPDLGRTGLGTPMVATANGPVRLDSARAQLVTIPATGPMRALVRSRYTGVRAGDRALTVRLEREIQARSRWMEQRLRVTEGDTAGLRWTTGLMRHPAAPYLYRGQTEEISYYYTWGPQTAGRDTMGLAVLLPRRLDPQILERDTLDHWIRFDPDGAEATYRVLASWSRESDPPPTRPAFEATIRQIARRWVRTTRVRRIEPPDAAESAP